MILNVSSQAAHWYTASGESFHSVRGANGQMRPTTLRDAKKMGNLYPSVTSILKILNKDVLVDWRISQAILSALTLPRKDGESETDFANRVIEDMGEQSRKAAEKGSEIHEQCEYLHRGLPPPSSQYASLCDGYRVWFNDNVLEVLKAEDVVVGIPAGFAGRRDLLCVLKDHRKAVVDIKTQAVKEKPNFYPEWAMQLSAYSYNEVEQPARISVVIDSQKPSPVYVKEWENHKGDMEAFLNCVKLWQRLKNYAPSSK